MENYFSNTVLLKTPGKRAAFSDRTAYLMAEMSRLAYFRFEGGSNIAEILESVKALSPEHSDLSAVTEIIKSTMVPMSSADGKKLLGEILQPHGFEVVQVFNSGQTGAQAFICRNLKEKFAILSFRGTEPSLKDIKADIKANLQNVTIRDKSVEIHGGYLKQFLSLQDEINKSLNSDELKDHQLFITGHSLGGALAITATKFLANDITGACYTFGSPPVGTKEFDYDIVTPIYRIINHVDIVPRLPNPTMVWLVRIIATVVISILELFGKAFSAVKDAKWYKKASNWLKDAQKYRQSGYGSYLVGNGTETRLRYQVGTFDRFKWWIIQFRNIWRADFKLLSDHSIEEYSRKLAAWASYRQSQK